MCQSERCGAIWCRLAGASCWTAICGSCGTRPLRPHAALLHKAALHKVVASHCAKAPFCVAYRFAPCGFTQQALCKVAFAGGGRTAVGATRSVPALRAADCTPLGWLWRRGISQLLRKYSSQWPAASHHQLAPAHPTPPGPRRFAASAPWRRSARLPPGGSPQSGAKTRRLSAALKRVVQSTAGGVNESGTTANCIAQRTVQLHAQCKC